MIRTKEASRPAIWLLLLLQTLLSVALARYAFGNVWLATVYTRTLGVLQPSLFYGILLLIVCAGGVLFWFAGMTAEDVGLSRSRLRTGFQITGLIWAASHVWSSLASLLTAGHLTLISLPELLTGFGALLAAAGGMALYEEIVFRGFLFPQFYLKLRLPAARPGHRLAMALIGSQSCFAIVHLPVMLIHQGSRGTAILGELLVLGLVGCIAAVIYLQTGNLFVVIGIHALANAPMPLVTGGPDASTSIIVVSLIVCFSLLVHERVKHREEIAATVPIAESIGSRS